MLGKRYNNNSSKKRKHISFVFIIKIIDRSRGGFEKNKKNSFDIARNAKKKCYIDIIYKQTKNPNG